MLIYHTYVHTYVHWYVNICIYVHRYILCIKLFTYQCHKLHTSIWYSLTGEGCSVTLTITPVRANVTVLTGREKVQLNCTTDIPVENISWTYNGSSLPENYTTVTGPTDTVPVSTLTLINPTPSKSGEYSCFVPLNIGSASATLNIQGQCWGMAVVKFIYWLIKNKMWYKCLLSSIILHLVLYCTSVDFHTREQNLL